MKDLHSEDILYGHSSWLPALEPLGCNYHIGDNYYRGSFSGKYLSCGLYYLLWYSQVEKFQAQTDKQVTHQAQGPQFLAGVDQQTFNDAFSLIGDSLKRVSPCQNEARSKFSEIVHPPWHPAPVTFGGQEKVSPAPGSHHTNPNKVLKCCKVFISHVHRY